MPTHSRVNAGLKTFFLEFENRVELQTGNAPVERTCRSRAENLNRIDRVGIGKMLIGSGKRQIGFGESANLVCNCEEAIEFGRNGIKIMP